MFLMFGSKSKTTVVKGGEQLRRKCPKCGATGLFHEAKMETKVNAFVAVELFTDEATVFVCAACSEVMPKDQTLPPTLTPAELAAETKRLEAEAASKKKALELAATQKAKKVDDDLAALKKKMGL